MNASLQLLAVFVIVALAAGYATLLVLPERLRRRLAPTFARRACGSCDECSGCGSSTEEKGAAPASAALQRRTIPIRAI